MEAEVDAALYQRAREQQQQREQAHRDPTVMAHERSERQARVAEGMPGAVAWD